MGDPQALLATLRTESGYDTGANPRALATLSQYFAERLRQWNVDAVVCWAESDECVFAHTTAVGLSVPVIRMAQEMGLLEIGTIDSSISRAALVATRWNSGRPMAPMITMLTSKGVESAVAVALDAEPTRRAPTPRIPLVLPENP